MPFSIIIQAFPQQDVPVAHVQGSAVQGMFLHLIQEVDSEVSARLHDDNHYRPFTLSPLGLGEQCLSFDGFRLPREQTLQVGTVCSLRLTLLDDGLFPIFNRYFLHTPEPTFCLGETRFTVTNVLATSENDHPWSAYRSYPQLIDRAIQGTRRIHLRFLTPTSFSQGDVDLPLPVPRLVFQSYRKRFEEFFQVAFLPDFPELVERYVGIALLHRLKTELIKTRRVALIGYTGRVTYEIGRKAPPDLVFQLNLLADFAFFCGTGKKTTQGMGQTVRIRK